MNLKAKTRIWSRLTSKDGSRRKEMMVWEYLVVKSLRNWASAKERKADRRGRFAGRSEGLDETSAATRTSSMGIGKPNPNAELINYLTREEMGTLRCGEERIVDLHPVELELLGLQMGRHYLHSSIQSSPFLHTTWQSWGFDPKIVVLIYYFFIFNFVCYFV